MNVSTSNPNRSYVVKELYILTFLCFIPSIEYYTISYYARYNESFLAFQEDESTDDIYEHIVTYDSEENSLMEIDLLSGRTVGHYNIGMTSIADYALVMQGPMLESVSLQALACKCWYSAVFAIL